MELYTKLECINTKINIDNKYLYFVPSRECEFLGFTNYSLYLIKFKDGNIIAVNDEYLNKYFKSLKD